MLSDVTSAPRANRDVSADTADDFEWVNAWAAATCPQTSKPAAPEPMPQGTALVQELAHIPAKEPRAADVAAVRLAIPEAPAPVAAQPVSERARSNTSEPVDAGVAVTAAAPISLSASSLEQDIEPVVTPLGSPVAFDDASGQLSAASVASDADAPPAAMTEDANASATVPELVELLDEQPAPTQDTPASAPISFLDFAWRAKRWRNLFGIARHREPQTDTASLDPLEALPSSSDPVAPGAVAYLELAPAIAPDQLESDIAEIEVRRDALLAEWEQERHLTVAAPVAHSRTTDYVPILLGCVLGFTLLVVFGAAASFVSLR